MSPSGTTEAPFIMKHHMAHRQQGDPPGSLWSRMPSRSNRPLSCERKCISSYIRAVECIAKLNCPCQPHKACARHWKSFATMDCLFPQFSRNVYYCIIVHCPTLEWELNLQTFSMSLHHRLAILIFHPFVKHEILMFCPTVNIQYLKAPKHTRTEMRDGLVALLIWPFVERFWQTHYSLWAPSEQAFQNVATKLFWCFTDLWQARSWDKQRPVMSIHWCGMM